MSHDLSSVQPVVLVGGKSTRFGRDKLKEPLGSGVLVEHPIAALRAVFGPRVKLVGECDPSVAGMADGAIPDQHPGVGPIGGIISALVFWGGPVFVLAGDMPGFTAANVEQVLSAAGRSPEAWAVLAATDTLQPCAGVYRLSVLEILRSRIASGDRSLMSAVPLERRVEVPLANPGAGFNVNTERDLNRWTR